MKLSRLINVAVMIISASSAMGAQPKQELGDAIENLLQAGNYSWEKKRDIASRTSRPPRPIVHSAGETVIGGYSHVRIPNGSVVMYDLKIAFVLRPGGRTGSELTIQDIAEIHTSKTPAGAFDQVHPLPHELFKMLEPLARDIRKDDKVLIGEIDSEILDAAVLEYYLQAGVLRAPVAPPSRLGVGQPRSASARTLPRSTDRVVLSMWVQHGHVSRFVIEFLRPTIVLNGPDVGERDKLKSTYLFELTNVGSTIVEVSPEVNALYIEANSGRGIGR